MPASPAVSPYLSSGLRNQRQTSRRLWMLAALASLALHGGALVGLGLLGRMTPRSDSSSVSKSIPIELVEIAPQDPVAESAPSADEQLSEPNSRTTSEDNAGLDNAGSIPSPTQPTAIAPSSTTTVPDIAIAPSFRQTPSSPEPSTVPSPGESPVTPSVVPIPTETDDAGDAGLDTDAQTSPSPSPAIPDSEAPPEQSSIPQFDAALSPALPPLPEFPSTSPGNLDATDPPTPPLPSIGIAETPDPVEITASVRVRAIASDFNPATDDGVDEQSDRQTFTYDPSGQSGLAIASCPFEPEVHRFTGETVAVQVHLDTTGAVAETQIYKSSIPSTAYESFATCLAENWDFSRLGQLHPSHTGQLIVLVTVESTSRSS